MHHYTSQHDPKNFWNEYLLFGSLNTTTLRLIDHFEECIAQPLEDFTTKLAAGG